MEREREQVGAQEAVCIDGVAPGPADAVGGSDLARRDAAEDVGENISRQENRQPVLRRAFNKCDLRRPVLVGSHGVPTVRDDLRSGRNPKLIMILCRVETTPRVLYEKIGSGCTFIGRFGKPSGSTQSVGGLVGSHRT